MRVAFLRDVPGIAHSGEVKDVADGYARNFLLPRRLAVTASQGATKNIENVLQAQLKRQARAEATQEELAKKLEGLEITIHAKAGAKEKLYGQVTAGEIAGEIERRSGETIDKRKIELDAPIRQLGSYEAVVRFTSELASKIKVNVKAEEAH